MASSPFSPDPDRTGRARPADSSEPAHRASAVDSAAATLPAGGRPPVGPAAAHDDARDPAVLPADVRAAADPLTTAAAPAAAARRRGTTGHGGTVSAPTFARETLSAWLFLAVPLFLFALYVLIPIVQSLFYALCEWDGISPPQFVGLDQYQRLWSDPVFWLSLKNNAIWVGMYLLAPPLGLALALFLNQQVPGIRLAKSLFFLPFVLSPVVVGLIFTWFYHPDLGLLNKLLQRVGLGPVRPLEDEHWVTFAVALVGLWPQTAYCLILYLVGLSNVNPELIEAGSIDGARGWTMFWHVVLPQLRPASFLAVLVTLIGALRSFDLVAVMTQGGPGSSSMILSYYMYEQAIENYHLGYGASLASILFFLMVVMISFFIYRLLRQEAAQA